MLEPISAEMGELLASALEAEKYLECFSCDGRDAKNVFEEAVWTALRFYKMERKRSEKETKSEKNKKSYFKHIFGQLRKKFL